MPIKTLARDEVVSARPDTPAQELAERMRDENVGSVVITNGQSPVGIVTDRDLTTRVLTRGGEPDGMRAEDVMSTDICSADEGVGVYEAAQLMSQNGVRRLPICGQEGQLTGIITADDLIELFADEHKQLAAIIEAQRPPY